VALLYIQDLFHVNSTKIASEYISIQLPFGVDKQRLPGFVKVEVEMGILFFIAQPF